MHTNKGFRLAAAVAAGILSRPTPGQDHAGPINILPLQVLIAALLSFTAIQFTTVTVHAQSGTLPSSCSPLAGLPPQQKQLCTMALTLCTLNPQSLMAIASHALTKEESDTRIRDCVAKAVAKSQSPTSSASAETQSSPQKLIQCRNDANNYPDKAIVSCSALIHEAGRSVRDRAIGYANRSIAYAQKGTAGAGGTFYKSALDDANQAIATDATVADGYYARGTMFAEQALATNNPTLAQSAVDNYTQAIRLNPIRTPYSVGLEELYTMRAAMYRRLLSRPDLALKDYNESIKLAPRYAGGFLGRGMLETEAGDQVAGDRDLRTAKQLDPDIDN